MKKKYHVLFLSVLLLFVLGACGNKEYESGLKDGEAAIEKAAYEEAIDHFEKAAGAEKGDNVAATYLKQTENMVDGLGFLADYNFTEAEKYLGYVEQDKDGLKVLRGQATAHLKEMIALKETYAEVERLLANSKLEKAAGNYTVANDLLNQIGQLELEHPYFEALKEEIQSLQNEVADVLVSQEDLNAQYEQAKALKEEGHPNDALAAATEALTNDFSDASLHEVKSNLESLKKEIEDEQNRAEEQKNAEAKKNTEEKQNKESAATAGDDEKRVIAAVKGYWTNGASSMEHCYFADTYYVCATVGSEEYYFDDIVAWDVEKLISSSVDHINGIVVATIADGSKFSFEVKDNALTLANGTYYRVSRENIKGELMGVEVDDFFDINKYKSFQ